MQFPRFVDTDTPALKRLLRDVAKVVDEHGRTRVNGKTASERTFRQTHEVMASFSRRLHRLGFFIEEAASLREKHIRAVVRSWWEDRISPKTVQNQYSRIKIFCRWIGKTDIINRDRKGVAYYLPEVAQSAFKVTTVASQSKSWSGNGVDTATVLERALSNDHRHGVMLAMGLAFGLRKKEMLLLKPWKADKGLYLEIADNVAKNGRYRTIPLETGDLGRIQRRALEMAKQMCSPTEYMGWPNLSLKQSENRYYYLMKKLGLTKSELGITGHGARAEYAEVSLLLQGVVPPTLGGHASQTPKDVREAVIIKVAQAMGHNDTHTSGAYYGSFARPQVMNRLGARIGPTLVLDAEAGLTTTIWCNPAPRLTPDGGIAVPRSSIKKTTFVAVIEGGPKAEEISLQDVVNRWPHCKAKVEDQLKEIGLEVPL
jgi:integrase